MPAEQSSCENQAPLNPNSAQSELRSIQTPL